MPGEINPPALLFVLSKQSISRYNRSRCKIWIWGL